MTRLALMMFAAALVAGTSTGCSKPSEGDCRKALTNMRHLMGTENLHDEGKLESEVRRCRGGSSKKAVSCAIKAQTLDELRHCEFFKVPDDLVPTPPAGSATPPAGSGSEAGSAGSAAGSAGSAPAAGSASGSAAPTGSAASPGAAAGAGATSAGSAVGSAK